MRRFISLLGVSLLASGLALVAATGTAQAQCPKNDGTIPGSSDSMIAVGTRNNSQYTTIYLDDRDFADLDEDDDAGGFWVYIESNKVTSLQRGGDQVLFTVNGANPNVPKINPIVVIPPDPNRPVRPQGLTLFPNGAGGGSLSEFLGFHDDCTTDARNNQPYSGTPDSILF